MRRRCPSIMVTGSHIPFDRNGIKFNKRDGEVLKDDEPGILRAVQRIRAREYARPTTESLFADNGMFKPGVGNRELKPQSRARREYTLRYLDFFSAGCLRGLRIVVYQHSSVARDLLTELLISLGAQVIPKRRSEEFVPVDTEAMSADKLDVLKQLVDEARRTHGLVDAIVSTDGDGDRPLMAAVARDGRVQFLAGDLLGIVVADFLGADVAVVPVSANDAVDQWAAKRGTMVIKTKIGSPHVIAAMQRARSSGHGCVVGWEANGGFLTATDITRNCRTLTALPTRDATLPILAALCSAKEHHCPLVEHFGQFSCRFGQSGLVDHFPPQTSRALLRRFTPGDTGIEQTEFEGEEVRVRLADGTTGRAEDALMISLALIRQDLEQFFRPEDGFDRVTRVNTLDGIRVGFANGDIAHIRPSGNAPQLRIYAVADSQARADAIVAAALREPDGILRRLEAAVTPAVREPGFGDAIRMNITLTADLLARGETPEVIGTVSGSRSAQAFWQALLDGARESFRAREAISFQEDLPTNQALGLLLLWQRLEPHLTGAQGALVAFVFGEGTRSTPFTETDNGQKPAMATYVPAAAGRGARFLSMVELALRYFVPVQQFLRRSGFEGLVVKWGDEVQIPTCDLSGRDARFQDADIVRFVSVRELTADEAQNKDWVGVNAEGRVTAFIPRRPLELMGKLADRGLLQQRNGKLYGGINLGSIAVSRALLDGLLAEFSAEVNDSRADRAQRPALDPEFFTALTVAAIEDPATRAAAWEIAKTETAAVAALERHFPDLLRRLRRVIQRLEKRERRKFQMVALDFGRQFWGDIGQHTKMYEFFMALAQAGEAGEVARAIAGLPAAFDAQGNLIVNSTVSPRIRVRNSVLINVELSGRGTIERSVLVGTRAGNVEICDGFEILSRVTELRIEPRGGTYKVISDSPVHAGRGERLTTLFLTATGPRLFRVHEDTNLRDQAATYDVPILGNPLSFQQAHAAMTKLGLNWVENSRGEAEATVLKAIRRMD
jgi:phosphomannomutase